MRWLVPVFVVASAVTLPGQQPPPARRAGQARPTQMAREMRAKLTNAQSLLAALVTRDMVQVARAAEGLARISETEIASWQAQAPPEYAAQAVEFLRAVQHIREAARTGDIAAAGDGYTRLTSSCITCHRVGRDNAPAVR